MPADDWIDRQLRHAQPLPITIVPAHNETLESYLAALAAANRVTVDHLRHRLTGSTRKSDPVPLHRLASISGQPPGSLRHAIHEITDAGSPPRHRPGTGRSGLRRSPCSSCALARGHRRFIVCWIDHHDAVCPHHARWLGDGSSPHSTRQPDLQAHPEIVAANQRHRRIVRRVGLDQAVDAYRQAAWVLSRWHDQRVHDHDFHGHMRRFHGPNWSVRSTDPTIAAATYPQIVALTRILASPHWRAMSTVRPEPTEFIAEVHRTVAPRYDWTLRKRHGTLEPLVAALTTTPDD